jgi:hypothetical protein
MAAESQGVAIRRPGHSHGIDIGIAAQSDNGEQLVHVGTYENKGTGTTQDDYYEMF